MKKLLLLFLLVTVGTVGLIAQTTLEGTVTDATTGEPILFGTVALYKNDVLITGTETDLDGNYFFSDMDPGSYDLELSYVGYQTQRQSGITINAGRTNRVDVQLSEGTVLQEVQIVAYKAPLIEIDNTTSGGTVTAEKIRSLPLKNVDAIAATSAGIASTDDGLAIRGSRPNATVYYIDGIRVSGSDNLIPQSEIEQLQIITGGVEAKYGDLVGGAISITSKGPSSKFSGTVEAETSEGLDGFGYNLLMGAVSGPILKNKKGESILGYRFSGQYRKINDPSPRFNGLHQLTESQINQLSQTPTFTNGGAEFSILETLQSEDIPEPNRARQNEAVESLNITGKLDARLSKAIDVSVSGTLDDLKDRFAPSEAWAFGNWTNNPIEYRNGYRANFRFRHKLGQQGLSDEDASDEDKAASTTSIRNLYYTLQLGYEKRNELREDFTHEENFFNYGYFGNQPREWVPSISLILDPTSYAGEAVELPAGPFGTQFFGHQGYTEIANEEDFQPSEINQVLAGYNNENGFRNPNVANAWGIYNGLGRNYNLYRKRENDIISVNLTSGFDFLPGGSRKGRHSIQFGFLYEQRINRQYNLNPEQLWRLGGIESNGHITGLDFDNQIGTIEGSPTGIDTSFAIYGSLINTQVASGDPNFRFLRELRKLTGNDIDEYVNLDGLTPDQLSLGMFSPRELLDYQDTNNDPILDYYGYDYQGNKLTGTETFDDFFNQVDANGVRTFVSPAFKPIYGAAYVQDKFSFRDIIFRVGVRMDYYDANTKVLKDPYSLYDINTAGEFFADSPDQQQPGSVQDGYKVYVASDGSDEVIGYRQGDNWFDAAGTATSSTDLFEGGGLVFPSLRVPGADITDQGYDVDNSFEDYEAQINFMPRLAFSFPISDEAGFFAHYDVLYQRVSPMTYYYWERAAGNLINNPNLKPVRTIDYEVGFQKKLTESSALKVSAFYKEMKDLIQRRVYTNLASPVTQYETFSNLDFGTVKGFTFSYDRRRVGPIELYATYSLQFADGSGSDANSSGGINQRGPIRNLIPLSYDERHRITAVIDYRYNKGQGPEIAGVRPFQNAGVNFNVATVSGRPYSRAAIVDDVNDLEGGDGFAGAINGARLPWTFNVDMRIDKNFSIKTSSTNNSAIGVNVYLRVQNLFNARNVTDLFTFTGDADNDGYLLSNFGQDRLDLFEASGRDIVSYQDIYAWRLNAVDNFSAPRRMYLGVIFDF